MRKVCSFFYVLWILLLLSTSMVVFIPYAFLRLMQFQRAADAYLNTLAHGYGRLVFFSARVKLEVRGLENLPKEDRALVFVAKTASSRKGFRRFDRILCPLLGACNRFPGDAFLCVCSVNF